jgi:hypothetical protein
MSRTRRQASCGAQAPAVCLSVWREGQSERERCIGGSKRRQGAHRGGRACRLSFCLGGGRCTGQSGTGETQTGRERRTGRRRRRASCGAQAPAVCLSGWREGQSEAQRPHRGERGRAAGGKLSAEGPGRQEGGDGAGEADEQEQAAGIPQGAGACRLSICLEGQEGGQVVPGPHRGRSGRGSERGRAQDRKGGLREGQRGAGEDTPGGPAVRRHGQEGACGERCRDATTRQPPWRSGCHVSG